jgi:hypothetical protein
MMQYLNGRIPDGVLVNAGGRQPDHFSKQD